MNLEPWQTESTLFAQSGIAHLLGEPDRAPLVPAGFFAAGPIGYAAFCALAGIYRKISAFGCGDSARVNGLAALCWVNWKAAAGGIAGRELCRAGNAGDWPSLACKDGFVALVYNEKDWPAICRMVGDERLQDESLKTFAERSAQRDIWQPVLRRWASAYTKAELAELFYKNGVPAAPVLTAGDLLDDPLMRYRDAFEERTRGDGRRVKTMRVPHRIEAAKGADSSPEQASSARESEQTLPLQGIRILDLGTITAGAGTGGLLADMGAEVLKVESRTYPDPFRFWAGSDDSPLFKFNNRNKFGLDIDLKTDAGRQQFFELVKSADVVMENFRRGVIDRMGIGFEALREHNPRIVLASVSGQGSSGPRADHATYGSTLEANCGFSSLTCYEEKAPFITGYNLNYPDQTVCLYGAAAIALAVQCARDNNAAIHLDVSQRDTAAYIIGPVYELVSAGLSDDRQAVLDATRDSVLDIMLKSSDGRWVAVSVPDWAALEVLALSEDFAAGESGLRQWAESATAEQLVTRLLDAGCGAAVSLTGKEMFSQPTVQSEAVFARTAAGDLVKGFPFRYGKSQMAVSRAAPVIGEHNALFID